MASVDDKLIARALHARMIAVIVLTHSLETIREPYQ
jgi:hypothetical protein